MDDKDKIIVTLRKQLEETNRKNSALEQENALLSHQLGKISESELFNIPEYGSDEWANWMINLSKRRKGEESPL